METALLKYSLAEVIKKLRDILVKQGFLIENFDEQKMVVMAFRDGNWYRTPRHILFELSSMDNRLTRIDITASIEGKKKSREAEEVIEEKIVSVIYNSF
jgi:hypothetical protein